MDNKLSYIKLIQISPLILLAGVFYQSIYLRALSSPELFSWTQVISDSILIIINVTYLCLFYLIIYKVPILWKEISNREWKKVDRVFFIWYIILLCLFIFLIFKNRFILLTIILFTITVEYVFFEKTKFKESLGAFISNDKVSKKEFILLILVYLILALPIHIKGFNPYQKLYLIENGVKKNIAYLNDKYIIINGKFDTKNNCIKKTPIEIITNNDIKLGHYKESFQKELRKLGVLSKKEVYCKQDLNIK